jgi:hypothetical protein
VNDPRSAARLRLSGLETSHPVDLPDDLRELIGRTAPAFTRGAVRSIVARFATTALLLGMGAGLIAMILLAAEEGPISPLLVAGIVALVLDVLFLAAVLVVLAVREDFPQLGARARWARLSSVARDNPPAGFAPVRDALRDPGYLLGSRGGALLFDVVMLPELGLEVGNARFTPTPLGAGIVRGYLRIPLARRVPQMVLSGRGSRGTSLVLPDDLKANRVQSLEGDFGRHFQLFAPRGYDRDVLYVFTPDLMALLIDELGGFDLEFVDAALHLVARRPFRLDRAETYSVVEDVASRLVPKIGRQTAHYADDRSAVEGEVAPAGRRLLRLLIGAIVLGLTVGGAVVAGALSAVLQR